MMTAVFSPLLTRCQASPQSTSPGKRYTHRAETRCESAPEARHDDRAVARRGIDVEFVGEPAHGAQAGTGCALRGKAVGQAAFDIPHPRTAIERQQLQRRRLIVAQRLDQQLSAAGVCQQIVGELGGRDRDASGGLRIELEVGLVLRGAPHLADLAAVVDHVVQLRGVSA